MIKVKSPSLIHANISLGLVLFLMSMVLGVGNDF